MGTLSFYSYILQIIILIFKNTLFYVCKMLNKNDKLLILTILTVLM